MPNPFISKWRGCKSIGQGTENTKEIRKTTGWKPTAENVYHAYRPHLYHSLVDQSCL